MEESVLPWSLHSGTSYWCASEYHRRSCRRAAAWIARSRTETYKGCPWKLLQPPCYSADTCTLEDNIPISSNEVGPKFVLRTEPGASTVRQPSAQAGRPFRRHRRTTSRQHSEIVQLHFSKFNRTKKPSSVITDAAFVVTFQLASNQAQPLLIWWRRDLGLGASKNRRICNHYVFKVVSQNLAYWQRAVYTWADVGLGAERHNSHRCTCMLTMLNSEKVLYVLRLGLFVSSMSWCLESALRRCELRHSVTLKAELRRSIEVVLAGHHFVADLSTWFREVTDLSAASFCFDDQSGGILVLLKKKKKKLRFSRSLPFFLSTMLSNYAPFFLEKKKKGRGRIFQQRGRQIYARSGKNLLACILSHPSRSETVKDVLFIRRKESTCAKQESWFNKWRIDVAFSSGCTSRRHFGVVARHPSGGGTSLLEGIFPLNWPIRARLFLLAPRPKSRRHHINKGWAWFEATFQRAWRASSRASRSQSPARILTDGLNEGAWCRWWTRALSLEMNLVTVKVVNNYICMRHLRLTPRPSPVAVQSLVDGGHQPFTHVARWQPCQDSRSSRSRLGRQEWLKNLMFQQTVCCRPNRHLLLVQF